MIGRTNAGSGAALGFSVVGGTTQPVNPKDKTIWVNTSAEITGWIFSSSQPANPADGTVWIRTGISSSAAFNALAENVLTVYPSSCMQYISGSWAAKEAKSYLSGIWVNWALYLYTPNDVHQDVTGGYEGKAIKCADTYGGYPITGAAPTITYNAENMSVSLTNGSAGYNKSGSVLTMNKIDLTDYDSLTFKFSKSGANSAIFYVSQSNTAFNPAASEQVSGSASSTSVTLDVSGLSGEYYVGLNLLAGSSSVVTCTVNITEIVLA